MGRLQFQLEFLDDIVRTLQSLASTHDDLSRSIASRARTAQARGGSSWVSDQLMYASSILGGHRESLQSESAHLKDRLVIARSTAEGWNGNQADLRLALAGLMASGSGAMAASQLNVTGTTGLKTTAAMSNAIYDVASRTDWWFDDDGDGIPNPDCRGYMSAVMQQMGIAKRPGDNAGDVYRIAGWTKTAGFAHIASANLPQTDKSVETSDQIRSLNAALPKPGSFFEMGQDGGTGFHHSGIYLGSKDGFAYVAQSNWGKTDKTPGVFKVGATGSSQRLDWSATTLANTTWGSDAGSKEALTAMWHTYGGKGSGVPDADNVISFYSPPSK